MVWYSTPTGVVGAMVSIQGQYAVAAGPMNAPVPLPTDDVLLVSITGRDYLWPGTTSRTFLSATVG